MDFANLCKILPATKYRIKLISTTYVDSDAMPVDSIPKFNTASTNLAQEDREYIEEIDSGDEPLRGQDG